MEAEPGLIESSLTPQIRGEKQGGAPVRMVTMALRIVLGGVFLYAGVIKVFHSDAFAGDVRGFRLFPEVTILPVASFLPVLEIVIGAALLSGILYAGALLLSGGLLLAFGGAIISAMVRKLDIACGCFGHEGAGSSLWVSLLRDGILLFAWATLALLWLRSSRSVRAAAHSS